MNTQHLSLGLSAVRDTQQRIRIAFGALLILVNIAQVCHAQSAPNAIEPSNDPVVGQWWFIDNGNRITIKSDGTFVGEIGGKLENLFVRSGRWKGVGYGADRRYILSGGDGRLTDRLTLNKDEITSEKNKTGVRVPPARVPAWRRLFQQYRPSKPPFTPTLRFAPNFDVTVRDTSESVAGIAMPGKWTPSNNDTIIVSYNDNSVKPPRVPLQTLHFSFIGENEITCVETGIVFKGDEQRGRLFTTSK